MGLGLGKSVPPNPNPIFYRSSTSTFPIPCYNSPVQQFISSLGQVSAIIGAQWGDEGKGKATDILAEHFDVIARACGGANAGHTIVVDGQKHIFHLLPSGCMHEGKQIVLGAGMVNHLPTLLEEIETLKDANVEVISRLHIAENTHLLLDYHKEIDGFLEEERNKARGEKIGTTKRGIGPAYMDKAERVGLRAEKLHLSEAELRSELEDAAKRVNARYGLTVDVASELSQLLLAKSILEDRVCPNVPELINNYLNENKTILIEGAQATMLDTDHGTYPYVTSSSTTIAGALQGLGIAPNKLDSCIGVAKAYCTRVGSGEFLTEADGKADERLRDRGSEYGATTGRPRRCGWLHLPDLKYGVILNGFTYWNITKLDVLDEEDVIPVGVDIDSDGKVIYEKLPGWKEPTVGVTSFDDLPENAQKFLNFIEERTGVKPGLIGTGPGREDMIMRV